MTDKTHQAFGFAAAALGYFATTANEPVTWGIAGTVLVGSFVGSLLPDIDQPTANFWDSVPLGGVIGRIAPKALGGHRNLSHSILGYILFSVAMYWLVQSVFREGLFNVDVFMRSFELGFIAHLVADAITVQGIPIFWPLGNNMGFPPHPLHGLRIVTGKWFENVVVFPLSLVLIGVIIVTHPNELCILLGRACTFVQ